MLVFLVATFCSQIACVPYNIHYPGLSMAQCAIHGQIIALDWQQNNLSDEWVLQSYRCNVGNLQERRA